MDRSQFSYEWIETLPGLIGAVGALGRADIVGVDLEADSMHHYFEKVCLLQIATESHAYVIDPLAVRDLSALNRVFSDLRVRKVFHGADYDIRSLYRDFQLEVENLFDTQLAARFLGLRETGLEALLRNRFQVESDKKYQRADWSRRPLSAEMIEYAVTDGRYLVPLARGLEKELEETDRLSWAEEEFSFLSRVRFPPPNRAPLYLRVKGAVRLDSRCLAVLEALLEFRDGRARRADLPPFKIFRNESLLELAEKKPSTLEELGRCKELSRRQIERNGVHLLREIRRGLAVPEKILPVYPREEDPVLATPVRRRVKALKTWREMRAKALGIEPGILLNNALIQELAERYPRSFKEMEEIPGIRKWRVNYFGREVFDALQTEPGT